MTRELLVDTRDAMDEDGGAHQYRYYILVGQMEFGGGFACESYGVKILGSDGEETSVPNITTSVSRIDELITLLQRNCVSPTNLRDVIEDWL